MGRRGEREGGGYIEECLECHLGISVTFLSTAHGMEGFGAVRRIGRNRWTYFRNHLGRLCET
jgi:hypothetical protein